MAEKKKILYIVEAMGGGVFTYIVDLANELVIPMICTLLTRCGNRHHRTIKTISIKGFI